MKHGGGIMDSIMRDVVHEPEEAGMESVRGAARAEGRHGVESLDSAAKHAVFVRRPDFEIAWPEQSMRV